MERISTREAVNRLAVTIGTGFSATVFGLDVLADGGIGPVAFAPALVPVAVAAWDKHKQRKEGDVPDGVRVTES